MKEKLHSMACQLKPMEPWSRGQLTRIFYKHIAYKEADSSIGPVNFTYM